MAFWYWGMTSRKANGRHYFFADVDWDRVEEVYMAKSSVPVGLASSTMRMALIQDWKTSRPGCWVMETPGGFHIVDWRASLGLDELVKELQGCPEVCSGFINWTVRRGYATLRLNEGFKIVKYGLACHGRVELVRFETTQDKG